MLHAYRTSHNKVPFSGRRQLHRAPSRLVRDTKTLHRRRLQLWGCSWQWAMPGIRGRCEFRSLLWVRSVRPWWVRGAIIKFISSWLYGDCYEICCRREDLSTASKRSNASQRQTNLRLDFSNSHCSCSFRRGTIASSFWRHSEISWLIRNRPRTSFLLRGATMTVSLITTRGLCSRFVFAGCSTICCFCWALNVWTKWEKNHLLSLPS